MGLEDKPNGNKVIVAVAIFFIVGFVINLVMKYNQGLTQTQQLTTDTEILETIKSNSVKANDALKKLEELNKKVDELSSRVKVLEDNSKNRR